MTAAAVSEILNFSAFPVRTLYTVDVEYPVFSAIVSSVGFILVVIFARVYCSNISIAQQIWLVCAKIFTFFIPKYGFEE